MTAPALMHNLEREVSIAVLGVKKGSDPKYPEPSNPMTFKDIEGMWMHVPLFFNRDVKTGTVTGYITDEDVANMTPDCAKCAKVATQKGFCFGINGHTATYSSGSTLATQHGSFLEFTPPINTPTFWKMAFEIFLAFCGNSICRFPNGISNESADPIGDEIFVVEVNPFYTTRTSRVRLWLSAGADRPAIRKKIAEILAEVDIDSDTFLVAKPKHWTGADAKSSN
jgi:hypothetical protein